MDLKHVTDTLNPPKLFALVENPTKPLGISTVTRLEASHFRTRKKRFFFSVLSSALSLFPSCFVV